MSASHETSPLMPKKYATPPSKRGVVDHNITAVVVPADANEIFADDFFYRKR